MLLTLRWARRASLPWEQPRRAAPGRSSSQSGAVEPLPAVCAPLSRPSTTRPSHRSPGPGFVHIWFCIIQASFQFCK